MFFFHWKQSQGKFQFRCSALCALCFVTSQATSRWILYNFFFIQSEEHWLNHRLFFNPIWVSFQFHAKNYCKDFLSTIRFVDLNKLNKLTWLGIPNDRLEWMNDLFWHSTYVHAFNPNYFSQTNVTQLYNRLANSFVPCYFSESITILRPRKIKRQLIE